MPVDRAAVWFGDKTSSPTVANAASQVGTIGNRPNPALYDDRKRDQLRELVQSFIDDEAPAEELIAAYAEINSGRRVSVENSLVGLIRFSEGDPWKIAAITPHVYDHLCGGNLKRIIRLLLDANARSVASKEPTSFEDGILTAIPSKVDVENRSSHFRTPRQRTWLSSCDHVRQRSTLFGLSHQTSVSPSLNRSTFRSTSTMSVTLGNICTPKSKEHENISLESIQNWLVTELHI
jgi:hypothetical protein